MHTRRYRVAGMHCANCAQRVEHALQSVRGVENAIVDLDRDEVLLRASGDVSEEALADAVEGWGYTLVLADTQQPEPAPTEPARETTLAREPEPEPTPESEPEPEPAPEPQYEPMSESGGEAPSRPPLNVWRMAQQVVVGAFAVSLFWVLLYRFVPVPFTLLMVGETLFEGKTIYRTWVPLERISPNLVRAVIASEDNDFCRHWGFDFNELQAAWDRSQRGGHLRGASTISQQTAKNTFLWPDRSWIRKGLEAYFTVLIELTWPKRRIMEVYLNSIEWGPGVFGAEAAAKHWFGKPASRLTPLEAARLAAILPNPSRYKANPPGPYVNGRGYTIAARAYNVDLYGEDRCAKP